MDNTTELTILSLCTGYGGLELGLSLALENPLRVVAVEIEAYALANLVAKAETGKLAIEALYPDLQTFPAERFSGCFDIILAGFPCQPFSVAGKRAGSEDERHLWPLICRIIQAVKPVRVFLENVPGLLSARILDNRPDLVEHLTSLAAEERKADARGRWYIGEHRRRLTAWLLQQEGIQALAGVYLDLHDLGYANEAGLFTASEVGAPHKRQRLFILAHDTSSGRGGRNIALRTHRDYVCADILDDGPEVQGQTKRRRGDRWPARPGQPQYDWEEPRVIVGNATGMRKSSVAEGCRPRDTISESSDGRSKLANPSVSGAGNQSGTPGRGTRQSDVRQGDGAAGSVQSHAAGELADTRSPTPERLSQPEERDCDREVGNSGGQGQAQSLVGRTVDGSSRWVDRLRLCGNGVVPLQAAKAFRELM